MARSAFLHDALMIARRVEPRLTRNARELRANATQAERTIWRILSCYRPKFTRQLPIGPYIVDLACRQARLIVELDGMPAHRLGGRSGANTLS